MSDTPDDKDCIALEEPESIDDLGQLDVGDRVLVDDRRRPQTVIATGTRKVGVDGTDNHVETPVARVKGHWSGATTTDLRHKLEALQVSKSGEVQVEFHETETIVGLELGRPKDVRRTHVAGSRSRENTSAGRNEAVA